MKNEISAKRIRLSLQRELTAHEFYRPNKKLKLKGHFGSSFDLKMTTIGNVFVILWVLCLQTLPGTVEAGERLKRELRFPKGGSFAAGVALASFLPKGPTEGLVHVLEFDLAFPFPEKLVFGRKRKVEKRTRQHPYKRIKTKSWYQPMKRLKRSLKEEQKMNLLLKVEDAITRTGFNGSACASRFQCELRNISPENSLLEEFLFALFKTSFEASDRECKAHDQACPVSLLQVIMHSEQISAPRMV